MSRKTYHVAKEAHERWPALGGFLVSTLHGEDGSSVQEDVDAALATLALPDLQQLAREWWNWNATAGARDDVRFAIEAFDSGLAFDTAAHARAFMNDLYDQIIGTVRQETGGKWKP